ncbi:MAG: hypothetical protein ACI392_08850 [Paludibacteraceae bacterium]
MKMNKHIILALLIASNLLVFAEEKANIVNIYVDNTGSMFGYISQGNEFEWAISNLVTSINLSGLASDDNIHLHYINSAIFPYNGPTASFLKGVTVHNAKTYKGDLGKTCMSNFFSKVLDKTGGDTISIIISDFIISPGRGNDATTVLASESNAISNVIKSKLNNQPDLAIAMYRMVSTFNGNFYDCVDTPKKINAERPYYMWVISNRSLVSDFRSKVTYKSMDNGQGKSAVTNSYVFFNVNSRKDPKFTIQAPSAGSISEGAQGVKKAKLGDDGKYRFMIAIDLSQYGLLGKFLTEKSSYSLSNPQYNVTKVEKMKGNGTTHRIHIETHVNPTPCQLTLTLKNKIPSWVESYNIDPNDCDKIFDEGSLNKTFGIKTIADAVFKAFYYNKKELLKVSISINQK